MATNWAQVLDYNKMENEDEFSPPDNTSSSLVHQLQMLHF